GSKVLSGTLQAFLDSPFVNVHVDPSVDYGIEATSARSFLDGGNTFCLPVSVNETACTIVGVFEVRTARARLSEALDELLRSQPVAVFQVSRHGKFHRVRDAPKRAERDVGRKVAMIFVTVHGRDRVASRGDRAHAGTFDDSGARRVPDVRKDQRNARNMQLA